LLYEVDRPNDALAQFKAASGLLADLSGKHPETDQYRLAHADCLMQISELQRFLNLKSEARDAARQALAIREELAERHPVNTAYQLDYFDALTGAQSAAADTDSLPSLSAAEEEEHLKRTQNVLHELERRWSTAPADLYELSCYLTLRQPLLNIKQQTNQSQ
jgi:hypothetical protein